MNLFFEVLFSLSLVLICRRTVPHFFGPTRTDTDTDTLLTSLRANKSWFLRTRCAMGPVAPPGPQLTPAGQNTHPTLRNRSADQLIPCCTGSTGSTGSSRGENRTHTRGAAAAGPRRFSTGTDRRRRSSSGGSSSSSPADCPDPGLQLQATTNRPNKQPVQFQSAGRIRSVNIQTAGLKWRGPARCALSRPCAAVLCAEMRSNPHRSSGGAASSSQSRAGRPGGRREEGGGEEERRGEEEEEEGGREG